MSFIKLSELLGNLGEFVGAIAVVLTLLYLAFQIRSNTQAVRSNTFQTVVDSLTGGISIIAQDAELTYIWVNGLSQSKDLSETERGRLRLLLLMAIRMWENAFYQSEHGTLERSQWEGILRDILSIVHQPGFRHWWASTPGVVSNDFQAFINGALRSVPESSTCVMSRSAVATDGQSHLSYGQGTQLNG